MKYLLELREKRARLIEEGRDVLEQARKEKRALNADEQAKYDKIFVGADEIKGTIEREERQAREQAELSKVIDPESAKADGASNGDANEKSQRAAFQKFLRSGLGSLNEVESRALSIGTDSAGGYTVPPVQFERELIQAVDNFVFMRQKATKYKMTQAKKIQIPKLTADPADADWTTEILVGSEDSTLAFGNLDLDPLPLGKYLYVSNALLRDSAMDIEGIVKDRLAYKFAVAQEKGFLTGAGTTAPLGVFVADAAGISTGRDKAFTSATAVDADALRTAKYFLKSQYHAKAEWMAHRDFIAAVSKLKSNDNQYLWQPGLTLNEPDRLLGFPVNLSEYAPNTFTTGLYVAVLGDFSNYAVADVQGIQIQRLNELRAMTNQTVFLGRAEVDGRPALEEGFVRMKMG